MARGRQSQTESEAIAPRRATTVRRKLIAFEPDTWLALDQLARDSMKSTQELADEAFRDLLKKHHRPTSLREALRESARRIPANDLRTHRPAPRRR